MKHKVSGLHGALLDAAVAKAEGRLFELRGDPIACHPLLTKEERSWADSDDLAPLRYSTQWKMGGPIIERCRVHLHPMHNGEDAWEAAQPSGVYFRACEGPTPLVAAMRAYAASVFGDEVDL